MACMDLQTVSLRYFNIFGPRQDPTSQYSAVLAKFITQMLRGERPTIYGDGEQSRDFNYIDNAVAANLLAATAPAADVAGKTFNIATGHRFSLNETFELLKPLTGFTGEPDYAAERAGDIKHSLADIAQAQDKAEVPAAGGLPGRLAADGGVVSHGGSGDERRNGSAKLRERLKGRTFRCAVGKSFILVIPRRPSGRRGICFSTFPAALQLRPFKTKQPDN